MVPWADGKACLENGRILLLFRAPAGEYFTGKGEARQFTDKILPVRIKNYFNIIKNQGFDLYGEFFVNYLCSETLGTKDPVPHNQIPQGLSGLEGLISSTPSIQLVMFAGTNTFTEFFSEEKVEMKEKETGVKAVKSGLKQGVVYEIVWRSLSFEFVITPSEYYSDMFGQARDVQHKRFIEQATSLYRYLNPDVVEEDYGGLVTPEEFIETLKKYEEWYHSGEIDRIGFDIETTDFDPTNENARICMFSIADMKTHRGYAVAHYHPEVWMSQKKKEYWTALLGKLQVLQNVVSANNEHFVKALTIELQGVKKEWELLLKSTGEVPSSDEDSIIEALDTFVAFSRLKAVKYPKDEFEFTLLKINTLSQSLRKLIASDYDSRIKAVEKQLDSTLRKIPLVGHNIKFDLGWCYSRGIANDWMKVYADTYAYAVAFEGVEAPKNLEDISIKKLGVDNKWKSKFKSHPRLTTRLWGLRYDNVPLDILGPYSSGDALATLLIEEKYRPEAEELKVSPLMKEVNMAIEAYASAEAVGFTIIEEDARTLYHHHKENLERNFSEIKAMKMPQKLLEDNPDLQEECALKFEGVTRLFRMKKGEVLQIADDNPNGPTLKEYTELEVGDKVYDNDGELRVIKEIRLSGGFSITNTGAKSHRAQVLFGKDYYNILTDVKTETGEFSTNTKEVLKPLQSKIRGWLKEYEENGQANEEYILEIERNKKEPHSYPITSERYEILKECLEFVTRLIDYSASSKLFTAYLSPTFDELTNKVKARFQGEFKLVGGTVSGRMACLLGETLIDTDCGILRIDDIVENQKKVSIKCIDELGKTSYKEVQSSVCSKFVDCWVEVELEDGSVVRCTPDHRFVIKNPRPLDCKIIYEFGVPYKEAQFLNSDDILQTDRAYKEKDEN